LIGYKKFSSLVPVACAVAFLFFALHAYAQVSTFGGSSSTGPGPWLRLDSYGYVADIRAVTDAVANSTTLVTSATAAFTPADNGKIAWVINDGTHATVCAGGTVTYSSATNINLSTTCSASAGSLHLYIGTNNYAAWVAACNAIPVKGATLYIPGPGAVLSSTATPFCTLASSIVGDVTIWGDYEPNTVSTGAGSAINGTTAYIAAGYSYTNGGSGDYIADTHNANSGQLIVWVGDVYNSVYNSFFATNGFGAIACNGFNTALVQTYAAGFFAYQQLNGCQTNITGGVYLETSISGTAAIYTSGACNVAGLCKMAINGNAYICGTVGVAANYTNNGGQIALDSVAIDTNNRCSQTNQTSISIAATNTVYVTNSDLGNTGSGFSVNNSGRYVSSGGNYQTTSTGAGVYTGSGSWSLSQSDFPAPLTSGLSGGGTTPSPSVTKGGNVLAFSINVGGGGTAQTLTITFPTAPNGWQINTCIDQTTQTAAVARTQQIGAGSATQVTVGNFTDLGVAGAWAAQDIIACQAAAY